jgi:hypothetical protein
MALRLQAHSARKRVNISKWRPLVFATLVIVLSSLVVGVPAYSGSAISGTDLTNTSGPLLNGDFEASNAPLSWWKTFLTTNGRVQASVRRFDTNNDGAASFSAEFQVGQNAFEGYNVQRGGGIFQEIVLGRGDLSITADIASDNPYAHCNGDGGTIQLLVDGVVADEHGFGGICGSSAPLPRDYDPGPKYGQLTARLSMSEPGKHEIRFLITRGAMGPSGVSNFVDDVVLSGSAAVKPVVGKPTTSPVQPMAGKRLVVTLPVTRSDNGAALTTGTMICNPSVKGQLMKHAESFANGIVRLSLVVPKTARGMLKVKVTITTVDGLATTRVATFRIR